MLHAMWPGSHTSEDSRADPIVLLYADSTPFLATLRALGR
jgi:hypothetical protein